MLNDARRELIGGVMTSDGSESGADPGPGHSSRVGEGVNTHHTVLFSLSVSLFPPCLYVIMEPASEPMAYKHNLSSCNYTQLHMVHVVNTALVLLLLLFFLNPLTTRMPDDV